MQHKNNQCPPSHKHQKLSKQKKKWYMTKSISLSCIFFCTFFWHPSNRFRPWEPPSGARKNSIKKPSGPPKRTKIHITILHSTSFLGQTSTSNFRTNLKKKKRISENNVVHQRTSGTTSYPQTTLKKEKKGNKKLPNRGSNTKIITQNT